MYAKVINRSRLGKREVRILFLILVLFIAELFVFTWVRTRCLETGYRISKLNRETKALLSKRSDLLLKRNQYKSPERIAFIAEKYCGISMPEQNQIILLE